MVHPHLFYILQGYTDSFMTQITLHGVSDREKELIKQAADEAGMNISEYCRTRLRAGYRLWDAGGDFDTLEMQKRLDGDTKQSKADPSPVEPASAAEQDRFKEMIKRNLPTDQEKAVSKTELKDIVRDDVLKDALQELIDEGEAKYNARKEGFVRVERGVQE